MNMGRVIDLKPLSKDMSQILTEEGSELWLVKLDSVVYGPFETENLKHYINDNEYLFDVAEVSNFKEKNWAPFWKYHEFQRRSIRPLTNLPIEKSTDDETPFWIIQQGIKEGPLSFIEIDKQLEMGLLSYTDYISVDNGQSWLKIYELSQFDRRAKTSEELPMIPMDQSDPSNLSNQSFSKEKENFNKSAIHEIADLTWQELRQNKVQKFSIEDISSSKKHHRIAKIIKWGAPTLAMTFAALLFVFLYSDENPNSDLLIEDQPDLITRSRPRSQFQNQIKTKPTQVLAKKEMKKKSTPIPPSPSPRRQHHDQSYQVKKKTVSENFHTLSRSQNSREEDRSREGAVDNMPVEGRIEPLIDSTINPEIVDLPDDSYQEDIENFDGQRDISYDGQEEFHGPQEHLYQDAQTFPQDEYIEDTPFPEGEISDF